jgi:nucleoid-associated protein EbfC
MTQPPIDFSQLASFMPSLDELPNKLEKLNQKLSTVSIVSEAGGGMVKVTASVDMRVKKVEIEKSLLDMNDKEMLEDLIAASFNLAVEKCNAKKAEITQQELGPLASMLQNSPFMNM